MQVPAESSVTVVPFTPPAVHTEGVVEVIVTVSPVGVYPVVPVPVWDVAVTVSGDVSNVCVGIALKTMLWLTLLTVKVLIAVVAGA